MKANIHITGIVKETEKALCVTARVCYNNNLPKSRNIWIPKSLIGHVAENNISVETWFLDKLGWQNEFHGYVMAFEGYCPGLCFKF